MTEVDIDRQPRPDGTGFDVTVVGELDLDTADQLAGALSDCDGMVNVDLGGVTFMDSSGLGTLIRARNRVMEDGGHLLIRGAGDNVRRLFEVTGLAEFLTD